MSRYTQFKHLIPAAVATDLFFPGGDSSQPVHLIEFNCTGDEATVLNCMSAEVTPQSECDFSRAVGLICVVMEGKN